MTDETSTAISVPAYDDFEQNLRSIEQYVDRPIDSLSLKELVSEADRAIGLAGLLGKTKLRVAVYLGRIFNEAKEKLREEVGHGDWVQWYQSNIQGLALRTAEEYMRLARFEADGELDLENAETANTTISGALKQFSKTRKKQQSTTGGGNGVE